MPTPEQHEACRQAVIFLLRETFGDDIVAIRQALTSFMVGTCIGFDMGLPETLDLVEKTYRVAVPLMTDPPTLKSV